METDLLKDVFRNTSVSGLFISRILKALHSAKAFKTKELEKYCTDLYRDNKIVINTKHWFRLSPLLGFFEKISVSLDDEVLYEAGQLYGGLLAFLFDTKSLNEAIFVLDHYYKANHGYLDDNRQSEISGLFDFSVQDIEDAYKWAAVFTSPYPCYLELGLLGYIAKQYGDEELIAVHDTLAPCRKDGASFCRYTIFK